MKDLAAEDIRVDPNQITPSGLTFAQIDARQAEYVRGANDALAELSDRCCGWWLYTVSLSTFEVVVGGPKARDNMVISIAACEYVAGPIAWPNQRLRVIWHNDREAEKAWRFVLEDESVGFKAIGGVFGWGRGYDLVKHGSLFLPRSQSSGTAGEADPRADPDA